MKKFFLCCCIVLSSVYVHAQVDVDPLTGRLQTTIPLIQITNGQLSAPIALVYRGGGVKVEQKEGTVGMGWDLSAGGGVYRERRGLPDDFSESSGRQGWLTSGIGSGVQNFNPPADDNNLATCADERAANAFLAGLADKKDTEPDIFSFSAPGLSGSFVFDQSGNPQPMPYQDISISRSPTFLTSPISSLTIKNNLGVTYVFSAVETTRRNANIFTPTFNYFKTDFDQFFMAISYTTVWRLTSITSPANDVITYTYALNDVEHTQQERTTISTTGIVTKLYTIQEDVTTQQLQTITTPYQTITFDWVDNRINTIKETRPAFTTQAKSFKFQYADARDDTPSTPSYDRKAFLTSITEMRDCAPAQMHQFEYDDLTWDAGASTYWISLGFPERKFEDLWGYCNGTSPSKTPNIYYNPSKTGAERFRAQPISSYGTHYTGASRYANDAAAKRGSMTKITYPNGGSYNITYECNQYYDAEALTSLKGAGIRVSSITTLGAANGSSEITTNYEYLTADGTKSSGKLSYPPSYAFDDGTTVVRTTEHMGPESYVMYERTAIKQTGKGKTVYTFLLPGMYPSTSTTDWSASLSRVARNVPGTSGEPGGGCESIGNLTNGYYTYPWAVNQDFDYERGLPQFVTEYTESGAKVSEKEYAYQYITSPSSEATIKGLKYELTYNGDVFVFGGYSLKVKKQKVVLTEKTRVVDELSPGVDPANPTNFLETTTQYNYNTTHKLLEQVDFTNSDNIVYSTKYKYARDFAITIAEPTDTAAVAIKYLNDARAYGTPIETTTSTAGVITGASLVLYNNFGGKTLPYKTLTYPNKSGYTNANVSTNGGGKNVFNYNTDLYGTKFKAYAGVNPISALDYRNKKTGAHYGYLNSLPVAIIKNAHASEVIYDGFETTTNFGFTSGGAVTFTAYAGTQAGNVAANGARSSNYFSKGSSTYKASAWVYATAATTIAFKALDARISTLYSQVNVSYTAADVNKWKYFEVIMDLSSVPAPPATFQFQMINSNGTSTAAFIDEVLFYPVGAEVETMTYDIMFGKTSDLDERGEGTYIKYDLLGRPQFVLNKNNDVVQYNEYRKVNAPVFPPNSGFKANLQEPDIKVGVPVTFTSGDNTNCDGLTVASSQWKIAGVSVGTGASLVYTPTTSGPMNVEHTVTLSNGRFSTTTQSFCVGVRPLGVSITSIVNMDDPLHQLDYWETSGCISRKKFTAELTDGGCGNGVTLLWEYSANGGAWQSAGSGYILDFTPTFQTGYTMRCTVSQVCGSVFPCPSYDSSDSDQQPLTWVVVTQCP
jgi:hypothetical protein